MRPFWALGVGVVEEAGASNAQIEEVVLFGMDVYDVHGGVLLIGALPYSDENSIVNPMLEFATSVVITGYYDPEPALVDDTLVDLEGTVLVPISVPLPRRRWWPPGTVDFGLSYDDAVAAGLPGNTTIIARISVDGGEAVLAHIYNYEGSGGE